jgi:hypothetical protein
LEKFTIYLEVGPDLTVLLELDHIWPASLFHSIRLALEEPFIGDSVDAIETHEL